MALVDPEDYELVASYTWHVQRRPRATYARRSAVQGSVYLHTFLTGWLRVDHVDHDGLNNRRSNLRPATAKTNGQNRQPNLGRRFKGVDWYRRRQKWRAQITVDGRRIYLGLHEVEEDAARAYDAAALQYFETPYLNFPI